MKEIWMKIKESCAAIIAIVTALLTVVYAGMKLVIYVYWSGYFNELNIDTNIMKINFEGHIFQVIFFSVILLFVVFLTSMMKNAFQNMRKVLWKDEKKWIKRLGLHIKIFFVNFILSIVYLLIANLPLALVMCVLQQKELSFINVTFLICILYITELLLLLVEKIEKKDSANKKENVEKKIGKVILVASVFISFVLAITYCIGSQSVIKENKFRLVEDGTYAITYSDGERCVLHRVMEEKNSIVIFRNDQKIIAMEDCEYLIKVVDEVVIKDMDFKD